MAAEAMVTINELGRESFSLPLAAFQGLPSTLCKGCGHNSITSALIDACKQVGLNPYNTVKVSGIGCSSKTPAYLLQYSHGFNALHGRMPSVATGAAVANRQLVVIGISGDGDTANIGMGQFKHICRRNVPLLYIVENNGCYGLTKGQFSATADLNQSLRRPGGEQNTLPPFDLCHEAIAAGATFVARSFAGDRKQLLALLKAALHHKGTVFLDIISPCVTFNDFAGSTKGWEWAKEHEQQLHEIGLVARLPEIEIEQVPGKTTNVTMHDGTVITLRALHHEEHNVCDRGGAIKLLMDSNDKGEFVTGLIYIAPKSVDFVSNQNMIDTPLSKVDLPALRPGPEVLEAIMAEL